jgi:hypothetical protein
MSQMVSKLCVIQEKNIYDAIATLKFDSVHFPETKIRGRIKIKLSKVKKFCSIYIYKIIERIYHLESSDLHIDKSREIQVRLIKNSYQFEVWI